MFILKVCFILKFSSINIDDHYFILDQALRNVHLKLSNELDYNQYASQLCNLLLKMILKTITWL